jgi:hypothetical protein
MLQCTQHSSTAPASVLWSNPYLSHVTNLVMDSNSCPKSNSWLGMRLLYSFLTKLIVFSCGTLVMWKLVGKCILEISLKWVFPTQLDWPNASQTNHWWTIDTAEQSNLPATVEQTIGPNWLQDQVQSADLVFTKFASGAVLCFSSKEIWREVVGNRRWRDSYGWA